MPALEMLCGQVTAPGATLTALTPLAGNSFQIRYAKDAEIFLLHSSNVGRTTPGRARISSPWLHDNVNPINFGLLGGSQANVTYFGKTQKLVEGDLLVYEQSGSAVVGEIQTGALLLYYSDLPGSNGNYITSEEFRAKALNAKTIRRNLGVAAGSGYSGAANIVVNENLLKAGKNYAILGYTGTFVNEHIRIYGPCTANFGIGLPLLSPLSRSLQRGFYDMAEDTGLPCIPVFNADDRFNTFVDCTIDDTTVPFYIDILCFELGD